ncbi:uncharacterized protein LOC110833839 isoform X2 [Zootermopsis nevadensis]|uniref:uncharacterized protein LOC110833839 isoform X2 n=1 Tax=Zootermopsis nevadensis TaxID=136037 RepID=UPI000B8E4E6B|nr:uncharacterized protein LOC110833839 isoform X2 [Zootermopsis nevadensis]
MTPFWLLLALVAVTGVGGYIEVVKDWGCHTTEFRLTCRELDAQIAILDAFFTDASTASHNCTPTADEVVSKPSTASPPALVAVDNGTSTALNSSSTLRVRREAVSFEKKQIGLPVKHRCSGVNHCSFRLTTDYTLAEAWGPGVVFIKYACINQHITRNCQKDISVVGEGFVETPGYPQYSVERDCTWKLRSQEGQRVHLSFLDISLRDIGSTETECIDRLTVREGNRQRLSLCGEREETIVIESEGEGLDVSVSIRSKNIFPKRGVLFQYKALGCPPLKTPEDGYLVDHNASHAEYMCCVGFVFPDTSRRDRRLYCEGGHTWSTVLPNCINVTSSIWTKNSSLIRLPDADTNLTTAMAVVIKESDFIYDVMLPTTIICVLLIGNGVIIFIIFYLRKKRKLAQQADDEELGAIFQPHDGSISDKAISV